MRISDWSSDVCSSDLALLPLAGEGGAKRRMRGASAASCFATNIKSFRAVTARAIFLCLCHYCPVKVHNQSRKRLFYIVIRSIFPCHRFQRVAARSWPQSTSGSRHVAGSLRLHPACAASAAAHVSTTGRQVRRAALRQTLFRSEERRVGKECVSTGKY